MRHIDRSQVERPGFLGGDAFQKLVAGIEYEHLSSELGKRGTQEARRFEERFAPFHDEAMAALGALFENKCAYTERAMREDAPLRFHLHRPGGDAIGLDSGVSPEHYWWLQTDWANWMLIAPEAETVKGTNFPVLGSRARPGEGPDALRDERPLLIDPTAEQPAWWLAFQEDGSVRPRRYRAERYADAEADRGEVTIRLLDLNGPELKKERGEWLRQHAEALAKTLPSGALADLRASLDTLLEGWTPHVGAMQQLTARAFLEALLAREDGLSAEEDAALAALVARLAPELVAELAERPGAGRALRSLLGGRRYEALFAEAIAPFVALFPEREPELRGAREATAGAGLEETAPEETGAEDARERGVATGAEPGGDEGAGSGVGGERERGVSPSVSGPETAPQEIGRAARLARVSIRNFKAIEALTVELPPGTVTVATGPLRSRLVRSSAVSWKMLLGENASGKSTVLQAIALALHGPELAEMEAPPIPVHKARRRGMAPDDEAFITLDFRGHEPVTLRLTPEGYRYDRDPDYRLFVRGYGATRLMGRGAGVDAAEPSQRRRVGNLFDPRVPVVDVDAWLLSLDEGDFNVAARAIRQLVSGVDATQQPLQEGLELRRDRDAGTVTLGQDALRELSDGYQSLLALACDIMAGIGEGLSDMENGVGIVLLDEIGAHLHPRLRMQIVSRLRYTFPSIQFLASTHEPLCLRGLHENEVDRIWRIQGRVSQQTIARSPSSFRVDQLLTSEYFGLDSTIDPEVDGEFQEYYHLLAKDALSAEEEARRKRLRDKLITLGVLGYTRRDQLVYEAIDDYLADERRTSERPGSQEAKARKGELFERIRRYWALAELEHLGDEAADDQG